MHAPSTDTLPILDAVARSEQGEDIAMKKKNEAYLQGPWQPGTLAGRVAPWDGLRSVAV